MSEKNRIHNYSREKKKRTPLELFIDFMIAVLVLIICFLIYKYVSYDYLKYGLILLFIFIGIICTSNFSFFAVKDEGKGGMIHKVAHINEEREITEEWNLYGEISLIIGKSTKDQLAHVDLSKSQYAAMINPQHALLNFAAGNWYIEDISPSNGISIQKQKDKVKYKITSGRPCKLDKGDIIFIANTKLLII